MYVVCCIRQMNDNKQLALQQLSALMATVFLLFKSAPQIVFTYITHSNV